MDIPTYLDDLDSLTNIIDLLVISPTENETYNAEEQVDMIGTIMQLMYDYVLENPSHIQNPTFHEDMMESVEELIRASKVDVDTENDSDDETFDDLGDVVNHAIDLFYMQIMPKRSTETSETNTASNNPTRTYRIRQVLARLNATHQPPQRTNEWYAYRHSLITASNAYKIFDTPGCQNQLIYEKCLPLPVAVNTSQNNSVSVNEEPVPTVNVSSPMHWGQKYEPVSTMYYEMMHGTNVGEYGCIQHSKYSFLGASPDGIVDDPTSAKYGQMLEIKNIVNRDITGVPLKAYWVQMQLQLEVCDLDECDFLETRFKEYGDNDAFMSDCGDDNVFTRTRNNKWKGVVLYFIDTAGVPVYEYKPLEMGQEEYESNWEPEMRRKHDAQGHRLMWPLYWWLEEVNCVLVERNRLWFSQVIGKMSSFWDTILQERETGYAHRAPAKRKAKDDGLSQCLITINGTLIGGDTPETNTAEQPQNTMDKYLVPNEPSTSPPKNIVHIRTQSFDDAI